MDHLMFYKEYCNPVTLEEVLFNDQLDEDKIHVALTFDDGFETVSTTAFPILRKFNIPFSIFINREGIEHNQIWVSNLVVHRENKVYLARVHSHFLEGKVDLEDFLAAPSNFLMDFEFDRESNEVLRVPQDSAPKIYMDLDDVRNLVNKGVPVGNHTGSHFILSRCPAGLQREEVMHNKEFLETELKVRIEQFALPFGKREHYSDETIDIINETGHTMIFSSNVVPFSARDASNLVPRIALTNETVDQIIFYMNRTIFKKYEL